LIEASAGIAELGRRVIVRGRDLHHDCLGMSFVEYVLFAITGRDFEPRIGRVFERLFVSTGYPDARIWCNRIAGYLGSARVDAGLALSAAVAASNSVGYGFRALRGAYAVQLELESAGTDRERWLERALAERRVLSGYGRPIHGSDERIPATLEILNDAGLKAGPALRRAFWLHDELSARKGIQMNVAAAWAALALDFGLSGAEFETLFTLVFAPGYLAVYLDQRTRAPLAFLAGHQTMGGGAV
jgi:hypothetical protein